MNEEQIDYKELCDQERQSNEENLNILREDLKHQLRIENHTLDWEYFVSTAMSARKLHEKMLKNLEFENSLYK